MTRYVVAVLRGLGVLMRLSLRLLQGGVDIATLDLEYRCGLHFDVAAVVQE